MHTHVMATYSPVLPVCHLQLVNLRLHFCFRYMLTLALLRFENSTSINSSSTCSVLYVVNYVTRSISVSSLVMIISPTWPKSEAWTSSSLTVLASSPNTIPPVAIAMSWSVALRLSPKPGAFTAATWSPIFKLKNIFRYSTVVLLHISQSTSTLLQHLWLFFS